MKTRTIDEIAAAFASDSNERGRMADAIRQAFEECPPTLSTDLRAISESRDPGGLYLRTALANGEASDGRPFEVSLNANGAALILSIGAFGAEDREVHLLTLASLIPAWLRAVGAMS